MRRNVFNHSPHIDNTLAVTENSVTVKQKVFMYLDLAQIANENTTLAKYTV